MNLLGKARFVQIAVALAPPAGEPARCPRGLGWAVVLPRQEGEV